MFGLVYLFGLMVASPLYAFLYVKVRAKKKWVLSIGVAGGIAILSYFLLIVLSNTVPYNGKLWPQ